MRPYEVMVILDAGLEEDAIRSVIDRSTQAITGAGGTVGKVDRWGKRRFAYEMRVGGKNRWEGYYVLLEAVAEPAAMTAVDRLLRLSDDVLRHKVIRIPDHVAGRARRPLTPADAPETPDGAEPAPTGA